MTCEICQKQGKTVHVKNSPADIGKYICINCIVDKVEYGLI